MLWRAAVPAPSGAQYRFFPVRPASTLRITSLSRRHRQYQGSAGFGVEKVLGISLSSLSPKPHRHVSAGLALAELYIIGESVRHRAIRTVLGHTLNRIGPTIYACAADVLERVLAADKALRTAHLSHYPTDSLFLFRCQFHCLLFSESPTGIISCLADVGNSQFAGRL